MAMGRLLVLKVALSLTVVWTIAWFGPSRQAISARIAEHVSHLPSLQLELHPLKSPRDQYNSSKLALLIEPRPMGTIAPLLLHMMAVAPPDWPFLFLGSNESITSVRQSQSIKEHEAAGKLVVREPPPQFEIRDREGVARALTSTWFYDNVTTNVEWLFLFGVDSILCASSTTSLNDWLGYDWVSPPWEDRNRPGGSGGFSMRRISRVKRVLAFQQRTNNTEHEDEFLTGRMARFKDSVMALPVDGDRFGVERSWYQTPMGFHVGDQEHNKGVWDNDENRKIIWDYCPELKMLIPMKLDRERCPEPTEEERKNENDENANNQDQHEDREDEHEDRQEEKYDDDEEEKHGDGEEEKNEDGEEEKDEDDGEEKNEDNEHEELNEEYYKYGDDHEHEQENDSGQVEDGDHEHEGDEHRDEENMRVRP